MEAHAVVCGHVVPPHLCPPYDYKRTNYSRTDCAWATLRKHPAVRYNRKLHYRGRIRGSVSDPRWHVIARVTP